MFVLEPSPNLAFSIFRGYKNQEDICLSMLYKNKLSHCLGELLLQNAFFAERKNKVIFGDFDLNLVESFYMNSFL